MTIPGSLNQLDLDWGKELPGQDPLPLLDAEEVYTISASAGTGGTITPCGMTPIVSGDSKSFTITAKPGSVITDVTIDGHSVGPVSSHTFSMVNSNHTIQATFASSALRGAFLFEQVRDIYCPRPGFIGG